MSRPSTTSIRGQHPPPKPIIQRLRTAEYIFTEVVDILHDARSHADSVNDIPYATERIHHALTILRTICDMAGVDPSSESSPSDE